MSLKEDQLLSSEGRLGKLNYICTIGVQTRCMHRAELCDTSGPGYLTGAMALNLKDRDDKGQDAIKKNGRIDRDPPAFYIERVAYDF